MKERKKEGKNEGKKKKKERKKEREKANERPAKPISGRSQGGHPGTQCCRVRAARPHPVPSGGAAHRIPPHRQPGEKSPEPRVPYFEEFCALSGLLKFRFDVLLPLSSFPGERNRRCVSTPYPQSPLPPAGPQTRTAISHRFHTDFTPISHPFHTHFPGVAPLRCCPAAPRKLRARSAPPLPAVGPAFARPAP